MSTAPGFPSIGRTVPASALTAATAVAGTAASWFVVGLSGWLVIALLLVVGAAAVPRSPFAAILTVQLSAALMLTGTGGYSGRFVLLLAAVHLLFVVGALSSWLPFRARVQTSLLRPFLVRYLAVQVAAQAVAFVVLTFIAPAPAPGAATAPGIVWLGIVAAVAALTLALVILAPALLRPAH